VGLFVTGAIVLALASNALWPTRVPAQLGVASFFAGWLTSELAFHLLLGHAVVVSMFVHAGALGHLAGRLGLGLSGGAALLLCASCRSSLRSRAVLAPALHELPAAPAPRAWRQLLWPIPVTHPEVERVRDVVYHDDGRLRLRLDVLRRHGETAVGRPALIYAHGGGWMIGHRRYQGLPTLQRLAARGWVCFSVEYRLSPRATFPDHVIDLKRAIAWVRAHAAEWGVDGSFIVVAGGSAGAHLASLSALTPHRADWQPGFESADTRVQACVSYYGVYDFTDRFGHWPTPGLRLVLERWVMKATLAQARERFFDASPLSHVAPDAPPFLVAHGTHDSLVPVDEARAFVAALRARSRQPIVYLEVPGAQHAFEIFPSLRSLAVVDGVERFVTFVHARHQARR
jgi:acetyl esterase/lipase